MSTINERRRRVVSVWMVCFVGALAMIITGLKERYNTQPALKNTVQQVAGISVTNSDGSTPQNAADALQSLAIKGRAPKTGYQRSLFSSGWQDVGDCDVRNVVLARDLIDAVLASDTDCTVLRGVLNDPYTGKVIQFMRGATTSADVQIDHVVALSDAWQKGAQELSPERRYEFANDVLNLLAVDGAINQQKGDADAATWLPPNKNYRCMYVARQIAVKLQYQLWVTTAEKSAMQDVLKSCPDQLLPIVS